jgi:hypothetical protein
MDRRAKIFLKRCVGVILLLAGLFSCQGGNKLNYHSVKFEYHKISGIGHEKGFTRRDPSDIIKVGNTWFVWYTKVKGRSPGYWGTIWYAVSEDEGKTWKEMGEALGKGEPGSFDSYATFTPNIFRKDLQYYLYYTGVKHTPGKADSIFENNSVNDVTAIGLAISDSPYGPFIRVSSSPVLTVSKDPLKFDSYRIDDAAIIERNGKIWLYYKGRSRKHGEQGPAQTKMGVAFADSPVGPFKKYIDPVLSDSHEVLVWKEGRGVAALASRSSSIEYAPDGLDFQTNPVHLKVNDRPNAPGIFRPDLSSPEISGHQFEWGISMIHNGQEPYLIRFECIKNE